MVSSVALGASRAWLGRALRLIAFASVLFSTVRPVRAGGLPDLSVDLHAHLFMKPGLGWFFSGSFDESLQADSWDDRLSSKANATTLDASGVGIMVVALFAHPAYRMDVRAAVREQIAAVEAFAKKSERWAIAKSPREAEALLMQGKRVLVLSIEGAGGLLESEEDLREFIDEAGVRIVTPLHLVDDRFGGAATMNGFQYFANPLNVIDQTLDAHCDHGLETNRQGLTPVGERLAIELVRRGVWLDLTHASDAALDTLVPIAQRAAQPLLFTHTTLRSYRPTERALSRAMLARVKKSGGLIGLLPSNDALQKVSPAFCPKGCNPEGCSQGVTAFATLYEEVGRAIGFENVMMGSDFNGGMRHLPASCGTGGALDQAPGYYHLGQTAQLWRAMKAVGASVPPMRMTVRAFLDAWSRVHPADYPAGDLPELPTRDDVAGPGWMLELGAGLSSAPRGKIPAVVVRMDSRISKDTALPAELEPIFYFAHVDGDLALSPDERIALPYATIGFSPVGVRVAWFDDVGEAEAIRAVFKRNIALDQRHTLTLSALSGVVRTMPGILKAPGQFNFYLELGIDLLGYDFLRHFDPLRPDLHGVFLAGGDLGLGFRVYPAPMRIGLGGTLGADISAITNAPVAGFVYQSEVSAGGALELGTDDGRFVQRTSLVRYYNIESDLAEPYQDTQLRGTFSVGF